MMKKLLSLLFAVLLVSALGTSVSAFYLEGNQTFGKSAPYLQITAGTDPDTTYEDIAAAKQPQYLIGVYEAEQLEQEIQIVVRNNRYDYWTGKEDLSAARFIDRHGNDVVFVDYLDERFVVFSDEPDTLYPIGQFLEEDFTTPVPHDYSLNEYVKAAVFLQMQPNLKLEKYRNFTSNGFDDALKEISAAFWPEYSAWEAQRNQNIKVCVAIGILLFVGGLAALLVILGKKGKLKINNDFINKIWVPALKKWRN